MTDSTKVNADTTALVIIDMQQAYFNAGDLAGVRQELSEQCNRLIAAFRAANRPVIFIRTAHHETKETWTLNMLDDKKGYLFDNSDEVVILKELDVNKKDIIITKLRDSAFYATTFQQILASHHIDTLVLAGVSTHSCIALTAADAYARNLRVILVEDAIASHDSRYHEPVLALLAQEYRQQRKSVDEVARWVLS